MEIGVDAATDKTSESISVASENSESNHAKADPLPPSPNVTSPRLQCHIDLSSLNLNEEAEQALSEMMASSARDQGVSTLKAGFH